MAEIIKETFRLRCSTEGSDLGPPGCSRRPGKFFISLCSSPKLASRQDSDLLGLHPTHEVYLIFIQNFIRFDRIFAHTERSFIVSKKNYPSRKGIRRTLFSLFADEMRSVN